MEEIEEVASILLELPRLIFLSELRSRFSLTWGMKRKRSVSPKQMVIAAATSPPSIEQSTSTSPLLLIPGVDVFSIEGPIEKVISSSSSPDTPLSFFPSELDEKPLPSKKKTSVNALKRDIEIKMQLFNQQITENLELKSKKRKLSQGLRTQTSKIYDHQQQTIPSRVFHLQPLMRDQMVRVISRLPSDGVGSSKVVHKVDHHGILDLNMSVIDLERLSKGMAAEARLKRKQICRAKDLNALCKAR